MLKSLGIAALASALALAALAEEVPVLLPVHTTVEGAHGSHFTTHFSAFNSGDQTVTLRGLRETCLLTCPPGPIETAVEPGTLTPPFDTEGAPGQIFFVDEASLADLHFSLRARDFSREVDSAGTEIPVVRPDGWRTGEVVFPSIPPRVHFRQLLRVYALEPMSVMVRVISNFDDTVLLEETLALSAPAHEFDPAYAQLAEFPDSSVHTRIELLPVTPGAQYWAFMTMTNNVTQEITLASPQ